MDASTFLPPPATVTSRAATPTVDHPGRWLGGLDRGAVSLVFAAATVSRGASTPVDVESLVMVGLLGAPVGFVLGRAALPWVRAGGWGLAVVVGMALGWAAPPLGALEIVLGDADADGVVGGARSSLRCPGPRRRVGSSCCTRSRSRSSRSS